MTAGFSFNPAAICRGVAPPTSVRTSRSAPASSNAGITAGFSFNPAAQCRGVMPTSFRSLGSAPDWMQSATSAAVAASKYSFEFQSAQSMAAIGAATTVKQRLIPPRSVLRILGALSPRSLADHTISVSVAHEGVCRMVTPHGCDAVTPRLASVHTQASKRRGKLPKGNISDTVQSWLARWRTGRRLW